MKLLSRQEAESSLKSENGQLLETNIRLRKFWQQIVHKLNTVRESYEPEKLQRLKDFEEFCKDILSKKSKLLEELAGIEKLIEQKKELYYSLVVQRDVLDEKMHQMKEQERKFDLREKFVMDLERKWREKNADLHDAPE